MIFWGYILGFILSFPIILRVTLSNSSKEWESLGGIDGEIIVADTIISLIGSLLWPLTLIGRIGYVYVVTPIVRDIEK